MLYLAKKWLICSWLHREQRCYPEAWKKRSYNWHCKKCQPCGFWFDMLTGIPTTDVEVHEANS